MHKHTLNGITMVLAGCGIVLLWLVLGSDAKRPKRPIERSPDPALLSATTAVEQEHARGALAVEAERDRIDQTVWGDELRAEAHEQVFSKLWDELRSSSDPFSVLAGFRFGELVLGGATEATRAEHDISISHWTGAGRTLKPADWTALLLQFKRDGYQLVQSEWRHAQFDPAGAEPANSRFEMTWHVRNAERNERLIVRGMLDVRWAASPDPAAPPIPQRIRAADLEVLSQAGPAAFAQVLAQEIRTGLDPGFIDPLIVYDLNGDGLSELILVGQNMVYWNLGRGEFKAARLCQFPIASVNTAVIADFNEDGLPDLLGADRDGLMLFSGDAKGQFNTAARRIQFTTVELPNAFVLAAGDVNGDGRLDVWLGQYKLPYVAGQMPTPYYDANDGFPSFLLLNDGNGSFHDATAEAGLAPKRFRRTYSASFIDLDADGDQDLVVVSDFAGVDVYFNDGKSHFTDVTSRVLDEPHAFGMAHTFGDYNGDGRLDFLVVGMNSYTAQRLDHLAAGPSDFPEHQRMRPKMAHGNRLFIGQDRTWSQTPLGESVARAGWAWGATSLDFDNDGRLDLYVVNGHKSRESTRDYEPQFWRHDIYAATSTHNPAVDTYFSSVGNRLYGAGLSYGGYDKNRLYMNRGGKTFLELGFLAGVSMEEDCRNVVSDDLDRDGRPDLIVTTLELWPKPRQVLHVFRNQLPDVGNWIGFNLREEVIGCSPVGAKVTLSTTSGSQLRHLVTGDSYRSQHSTTVHFGIGRETSVIGAEIRWPNGAVQRLEAPAINRYHAVKAPNPGG